MASPQKEKGFTPIAHEIIDHLVHPGINGCEYRVILFVIRKTYGFNKKTDRISLTQFQKSTLMSRRLVVNTLTSLVSKRVLLKIKNTYGINKNWEQWVVSKRTPSVQKNTVASVQKGTKSSVQKNTYKRNKETITKDILSEPDFLEAEIIIPEGYEPLPEISPPSPAVAEIFNAFKIINWRYKNFFRSGEEISAAQELVDIQGKDVVLEVINFLELTKGERFISKATTPSELAEKWAKIEKQIQVWGTEQIKKSNQVAF